MRKFSIHILPNRHLDRVDVESDISEGAAVITICPQEGPAIRSGGCRTLSLCFSDTEERDDPQAFNDAHASEIREFMASLPADISDLYVCCEEGESRSPAVAAALLRASGRSDRDVWNNPYYHPNRLVYRELCAAFRIYVTSVGLWMLRNRSERAFRKMQAGKRSRYEKWQILE